MYPVDWSGGSDEPQQTGERSEIEAAEAGGGTRHHSISRARRPTSRMRKITRRSRQVGRTMQLDVMQGVSISDLLLMRGAVFYRGSMGEHCSSIRYRWQTR